MADDEAVASSREASVGDKRNLVDETGPCQGTCWSEHFGHTGPSLGAFVADDDDITRCDHALLKSRQHVLFVVEHPGRSGELEPLFSGDLTDRSTRRQVAPQDADMTSLLHRCVDGRDDVLTLSQIRHRFEVLCDGLTGDRELFTVDQILFQQVPHHCGDTPHLV